MIREFIDNRITNKSIRAFIRKFMEIGYTEEEFEDRCKLSKIKVVDKRKKSGTGYVEIEYSDKESEVTKWPEYDKKLFEDPSIVGVIMAGQYTSGRVYRAVLKMLPDEVMVKVHGQAKVVKQRLDDLGISREPFAGPVKMDEYECVKLENGDE